MRRQLRTRNRLQKFWWEKHGVAVINDLIHSKIMRRRSTNHRDSKFVDIVDVAIALYRNRKIAKYSSEQKNTRWVVMSDDGWKMIDDDKSWWVMMSDDESFHILALTHSADTIYISCRLSAFVHLLVRCLQKYCKMITGDDEWWWGEGQVKGVRVIRIVSLTGRSWRPCYRETPNAAELQPNSDQYHRATHVFHHQ